MALIVVPWFSPPLQTDFALGTLLRCYVTMIDADVRTDTDPTDLAFHVQPPYQTVATYGFLAAQITKAAVGTYFKDIALSSPGRWRFRWLPQPAPLNSAMQEVYVTDEPI